MFNEEKKSAKKNPVAEIPETPTPETPATPETPVVVKKDLSALLPSDLNSDEIFDNVFDQIEEKESAELQEATSNYLDFSDFKMGEERNYIFLGMTTFTKPETGETIPAVKLMDRARTQLISAAAVVCSSLSKLDKVPCPVRIRVDGKTKGKNGSYYNARVFVL